MIDAWEVPSLCPTCGKTGFCYIKDEDGLIISRAIYSKDCIECFINNLKKQLDSLAKLVADQQRFKRKWPRKLP